MIKKGLLLPLMAFAVTAASYAEKSTQLELTSPGGVHKVKFYGKTSASGANGLYYTVDFKDKNILKESKAGLHVDNYVWEMALGKRTLQQPECWMDNMVIDSVSYSKHSGEWTPVYGERSLVKDNYNAGVVYMSKKDKSKYRLNVEVRAYDEGVAFRYFFPEHPDAIFHKVTGDLTEYSFVDGTMAWSEQWAQGWFEYLDVNALTKPVERTLTLELPNGLWAALTDADVDDWCLTKYQASAEKRSTLKSVMYSPVDIVTYYATPWKIVMAAEKPGQLLEHNYIIENLNPPCEIKDTSWIKPGKIMRSAISTESGLATIDFCAEHNIPYMLFDWQWYMPCTSHDGDATKVVPHVDMKKVIEYGKGSTTQPVAQGKKSTVTASASQETASNVLDGNLSTDWKANAGDYITFALGNNASPNSVAIAWKEKSKDAKFEIQLSGGGGQFLTVYEGVVDSSNELKTYRFKGTTASDLRILLTNGKASISEVKVT